MGLIVITFMGTLKIDGSDTNFFFPALIGLGGAIIGSVVSTRFNAEINCKGTASS